MSERIKELNGIKLFEINWGEKFFASVMDLENAVEFFHLKVKRPEKLFVYVAANPIELQAHREREPLSEKALVQMSFDYGSEIDGCPVFGEGTIWTAYLDGFRAAEKHHGISSILPEQGLTGQIKVGCAEELGANE